MSTLVLTPIGLAAGTAAAATLLFRATTVAMRMAIGWIVLLAASPRLKNQISRGGFVKAIQGAEKQTRARKHARESAGSVSATLPGIWGRTDAPTA